MEELIDVLDENGNETGKVATRSEVHKKGLWHRAVAIILMDKDNNILIQQRSKNVKSYPGYWDISAAGHVSAGQNYEEAAVREIGEEIGVEIKKENLKELIKYKETIKVKEDYVENLFQEYYVVKQNTIELDKIKKQDSEVDQVKICNIYELLELAKKKKVFPRDKLYGDLIRKLERNNTKKDDIER